MFDEGKDVMGGRCDDAEVGACGRGSREGLGVRDVRKHHDERFRVIWSPTWVDAMAWSSAELALIV